VYGNTRCLYRWCSRFAESELVKREDWMSRTRRPAVAVEAGKPSRGEVRPAMPDETAREVRRLLARILVADFLEGKRGNSAATVQPVHRSNPRQEKDA